jgi:hypothetical protein
MKFDESKAMLKVGSISMVVAGLISVTVWMHIPYLLSCEWIRAVSAFIVVGVGCGIVVPLMLVAIGMIALAPR